MSGQLAKKERERAQLQGHRAGQWRVGWEPMGKTVITGTLPVPPLLSAACYLNQAWVLNTATCFSAAIKTVMWLCFLIHRYGELRRLDFKVWTQACIPGQAVPRPDVLSFLIYCSFALATFWSRCLCLDAWCVMCHFSFCNVCLVWVASWNKLGSILSSCLLRTSWCRIRLISSGIFCSREAVWF